MALYQLSIFTILGFTTTTDPYDGGVQGGGLLLPQLHHRQPHEGGDPGRARQVVLVHRLVVARAQAPDPLCIGVHYFLETRGPKSWR